MDDIDVVARGLVAGGQARPAALFRHDLPTQDGGQQLKRWLRIANGERHAVQSAHGRVGGDLIRGPRSPSVGS